MSVLDEVAGRAAAVSPLLRGALRAGGDARPRFRGACPGRYLLGVETIYEGHLVHRGRSRLFSTADPDLALLAGDYLYAAGLREICTTGDVAAVATLAELISACSRDPGVDGASLWDAAVAELGR